MPHNVENSARYKKIFVTLCLLGAYIPIMDNELSYCELRRREVINGSDGRRLGHIIDIVFSQDSGMIRGLILPYGRRGIFGKSQDLFVPWKCVQKIGEDVILVEIMDLPSGAPSCVPAQKPERLPSPKKDDHECDGKCEKCMLFDCSRRWQAV